MKEKRIWAASLRGGLIAALFFFLNCEAQVAMPVKEQELASANSGFAFNLLKQLATEYPETNIFISPYSVSTVLQMVSTGAEGTTLTEMQQALGTIDLSPASLSQANRAIGAIINSRNTNFVLSTANAVWYLKGLPVKPSFIAGTEQFFDAKVAGLDFGDPASADIINAWASEETHGKIDQIVSRPMDPRVRMLLANAVYFLGNWETPFDTNLTMDRVFQLGGGGQEMVPMMERTGIFSCCATNGYQAVRLPYKGGNLAMYVFLPGPDSSLGQLLGMMDGAWWQQAIQTDFAEQEATVVLPKFNLQCGFDLVPPLEALGMETAFTLEADFSKICRQPLHIAAVKQQAVVEVNETGTEAAAVTTVTLFPTVAPAPPSFQMIVDRPFLFFIEDQKAETILFMGMVLGP